jgi:hypothetical protein
LRTHPSERRHDDAVRKVEVSHPIWREKWLIRHHMNSCMGSCRDYQTIVNRLVLYDDNGAAKMQGY